MKECQFSSVYVHYQFHDNMVHASALQEYRFYCLNFAEVSMNLLQSLCESWAGLYGYIIIPELYWTSRSKFIFNFFLIRIVGGGVQTRSTRHVGHWMAYCTCPGWLWWWRIWWNEDWKKKPKYSEKTCSSATLSTTNPTWPGPGLNPGRRGGKPATNRLSYGAASKFVLIQYLTLYVESR
jgi:hypothetical protein